MCCESSWRLMAERSQSMRNINVVWKSSGGNDEFAVDLSALMQSTSSFFFLRI